MLIEKTFSFISKKIGNINPELIFVFNNFMFKKLENKNKNNLCKINSPEYELYLKSKKK